MSNVMLELAFVFDDAIRAISEYADCLTIAPLPATVYLMQIDVINHYQYALDHYLTVPLDAPFLQKSSLGTPYQKWAYFTNEDFGLLSFAVHNLLRYTSRLIHESEYIGLTDSGRSAEMRRTSNTYTDAICEIRNRGKAIGVTIHPEHRLSITPVRTDRSPEHVISRSTAGGPTLYFQIVPGPDGNEREEPIGVAEYERAVETVRSESVDITDRARLVEVRERGHAEAAELQERNLAFKQVCENFYRFRPVTEAFENLNELYWI
jgi:hypothetical protein